jgi:hypothetical protein
MDFDHTVTAALAGHRPSLIALAMHRFGWSRPEVAQIGRGYPDAIARLQEELIRLVERAAFRFVCIHHVRSSLSTRLV